MNLPEGFSVFGKRNARQLAVLRAENALMRYCLDDNSDAAIAVVDAVRSVVNGKSVNLDDICNQIQELHPTLETNRTVICNALTQLWQRGEFNRSEKINGLLYSYTKKVAGLFLFCLLAGCSTPQFSQETTAPSRQPNWYADVDWPESHGAKTYHVEFGLHPNTMTNSLVTAANRCRINGLELGKTYYFSVRASDGKSYSLRTPIVAFKTP